MRPEKSKDKYSELDNLIKMQFEEGKSIPAFIKNINVNPVDYPDLKLDCGLEIPTPSAAIDRTQDIARRMIDEADSESLTKFSKYQNIINAILGFIRQYDVLCVHASTPEYQVIPLNQEEVSHFVNDASVLDKEINKVLPELLQPVSKITKVLQLDNELSIARQIEHDLYLILRNVYRNGLAEIFKYIVIGDNLKLK